MLLSSRMFQIFYDVGRTEGLNLIVAWLADLADGVIWIMFICTEIVRE